MLDAVIDDLNQEYITVDRIDDEDDDLDEDHGFSDTLEKLVEKYGEENEYTVVMGADSFMGLHRWRRYERILELAQILVIARPGFEVVNPEIKVTPEVLRLDMKISATQIRKDLKRFVRVVNEYPLMEYYLEGLCNYFFPDIQNKEA
jgi:nicotinic acid mononucleotide adenylyltransferase